MQNFPSSVETAFFKKAGSYEFTTHMPYILVDNFPRLGMLTALRFLEWVSQNPDGLISLPTGKTPEYFIKWTMHFLQHWDDRDAKQLREDHGLILAKKPDLKGLQFVQIDEFYPISPEQHNSFYYYIRNFYIDGFGLDEKKALLVNCDDIRLADGKSFKEVFPGNIVDLSLRYRECKNELDRQQQDSIFLIDDWCSGYEKKIQDKGGIGFFLGGIGPDGHIAFNIKGSDHYSTTRLTSTNFETQAVAATDLGGIEISRNRLVITIGLATITYNPTATVIIIAAGEAKVPVVRSAVEKKKHQQYPASVLQDLNHARFFVTRGIAGALSRRRLEYFRAPRSVDDELADEILADISCSRNKPLLKLTKDDIEADPMGRELLLKGGAGWNTYAEAAHGRIVAKIEKGLSPVSATTRRRIFSPASPRSAGAEGISRMPSRPRS